MRFQVPQFIEVEDKVFGPLTFKQFIYLAGGAGLSAVLYFFVPLFIAIPLIAIVIVFSVMLAFYKVNNKPFVFVVQSWLGYVVGSKLYVWEKKQKNPAAPGKLQENANVIDALSVPRLSESKLKDLAWSLDVEEFESNQQQTNNGK